MPDGNDVDVLLMAHIDVVDAADPQFDPVIRDGKLFGRGAIDDKYAVALSLVLAKEHVERLRQQGRTQKDLPFGVLITSDEEVGGHNGSVRWWIPSNPDSALPSTAGILNGSSSGEGLAHR